MVVDRTKNLLFIHVPRTGGTSIEKLMGIPLVVKPYNQTNYYGVKDGLALQHYTAEKMLAELGKEYFDKCFKFAVVRNPYTRMISEYYFPDNTPVRKAMGIHGGKSFKDFLLNAKGIVNGKCYDQNHLYDHFKPQHEFVYINDELVVDSLGKFENLSQYIDQLIADHGFDRRNLKHMHQTVYKEAKNYFDDAECRQIVNTLYKKDFEYFGYEMII